MRPKRHRLAPGDEDPWSLRDTLGLILFYVWGVGFTTVAVLVLTDSPDWRGTLWALIALVSGLGGLYLAIGATVIRLGEIIAARRGRARY